MEANAAGAALEGRYAALRAGAADLSSEDLLEVIELAQREKDAASARQAVALAHLSARESHLREDGTWAESHRGLGHQRLDAPELAAPRMGVSVHVASNRILTAIRQMTRTPAVVDAMASGELDEYRASIVSEETEFLSDESAAGVVARVSEHWTGLTPGPLRRFVARTAAEVDPDAVAKEAEDEREGRGLTRRTGAHGTDHWRGDFGVEHARGAWDAVTARAKQLVRDGRAETLPQARADAMMELILGHCDVKVVVHATYAADDDTSRDATCHGATRRGHTRHDDTAHGRTTHDDPSRGTSRSDGRDGDVGRTPSGPMPGSRPAGGSGGAADPWRASGPGGLVEVGGMGASGTTFVPAEWLDRARGQACGVSGQRLGASSSGRKLVCEPVTGALVAGDVPEALASGRTRPPSGRWRAEDVTGSYRIPAAMARLVRLRDGCCRFPGCSTPAQQCDIDHVTAWPTGPTAPPNLMALCRRHHRIKQRPDWRVTIHPDATVTWTDPTGYRVTTRPVDHLHLVTADATHAARVTDLPDRTDRTEGAIADALSRYLALPSSFEEHLRDLLTDHPARPLHARPLVRDADGTLISGPPPHVDLVSGRIPTRVPGPGVTVLLDHRPPPPAEDVIPF